MKIFLIILMVVSVWLVASCEVQSEIAKKSVEKYGPTPTPSREPTPVEEPIDPADIVQVDTSVMGTTISVNAPKQKKNINCDQYNQVMVNTDDNVLTIKGSCRELLINGDGNDVTAEALMSVVINGTGNQVRYTKFPNGKRPMVSDNQSGNTVEKAPAKK